MDPAHCLAIVLGYCLNGFTSIDNPSGEAVTTPVHVVSAVFDGGQVRFIQTDNLTEPNREALPTVCDASGAACLHYAKSCKTGPNASDPWIGCTVRFVRKEDQHYRELEFRGKDASALDGVARGVGFVMTVGDRQVVIPLTALTEAVVGIPTCRDRPRDGRQCSGEPWKSSKAQNSSQ
jgi:hypothetical protein